MTVKHLINEYLFKKHFEAFCSHVREESGIDFSSFNHNPYTRDGEGYKYRIHLKGSELLAFHTWNRSDIGSGKIVDRTISAIEFQENNLVQWQARFGDEITFEGQP